MNSRSAEEDICRAHCSFFKPNRTEEERCRGYSIVRSIAKTGPPFETTDLTEAFDASYQKSFLYDHVCSACPFLIDGCDFTSPEPPEGAPPCGGVILLSKLLKAGRVTAERVQEADITDRRAKSYVALTPRCAVKRLEEAYVYHVSRDELYEVNEDGLDFLLLCDGSRKTEDLSPDPEFFDFCLEEDLLELRETPSTISSWEGRSPAPSLRYLEWLVTRRCNLTCSHCYLGDRLQDDYPRESIRPLLDQFSRMQGLRILVTGGEPTLYPHFRFLNEVLPDYPLRAVLLTNGTTLDPLLLSQLNFHEVQVSLDGMEHGHEAIRGKGTFERALAAMRAVRQAGLDLSVATMIHRENLGEWDAMRELVAEIDVREWSIDYPCVKGNWERHPELAVGLDEAAERMEYGFGGSYHGTSPGWTCGRHLAGVLPSGAVCRCGLYQDRCYGSVEEGMEAAWLKVVHMPIDDTDCTGCSHADTCGGGCRFRAGGGSGRDVVMCRFYGVDRPQPRS
jgi:radical SAM protein with 4Fe4S-binding SPASM domain